MKRIQLIIKISLFVLIVLFLNNCGEDITGTYYISDEAKNYEIDTTITSINFTDNNGLSESFSLDQDTWYTTHHYFTEWGTGGKAFGETYGLHYTSTVNRFFFMYVLRADVGYTKLEIEWNQTNRSTYNFSTKQVESGIKGKVTFCDSLEVKGVIYRNIVEFDYADNSNAIDDDIPVKTVISGDKGLIKFSRKDGVIFERIE